ncbi:MAG TPA: ferritin-like domain-containing protein [bacterium]|nr:ferritin-like domain-containing protein [bacterium]
MGTSGRQIVGKNVEKIIEQLRMAFCDEWLAHYQYWVGAKVVRGPMKDAVIAELVQHAADEMRHATLITDRLIQLGGAPVLDPKDWYKFTSCGYDVPADHYVKKILEQNIKGEQCAIRFYSDLAKMTHEEDPVTYNVVTQILQDEVMHEEDLQSLNEDLELMVKHTPI